MSERRRRVQDEERGGGGGGSGDHSPEYVVPAYPEISDSRNHMSKKKSNVLLSAKVDAYVVMLRRIVLVTIIITLGLGAATWTMANMVNRTYMVMGVFYYVLMTIIVSSAYFTNDGFPANALLLVVILTINYTMIGFCALILFQDIHLLLKS